MKYLLFFLFPFWTRSAQCQYDLGKKGDFWNSFSPDTVCFNKSRDSLKVVLNKERTTIPLDSVRYLTLREPKSWWPYLLTAGLVGASSYTVLRIIGRDDGMYTAEGKARFVGILLGGFTLSMGAILKSVKDVHVLINPGLGPEDTGAIISCDF